MDLIASYSQPARLWLAGAAERDSNPRPGQGDQPDLETRSLRVLIVEDEFFISLYTKELLEELEMKNSSSTIRTRSDRVSKSG